MKIHVLQIVKAGHCRPMAEGAVCETKSRSVKSVSCVDYT